MTEEPLISQLSERLDDLAADVGEHDKTLMQMIRRGAREGAMTVPDAAQLEPARQLELVDRAASVFDRFAGGEKRLFDALVKSSLERRRHLAHLLSLPDDDREAVAFVLSLDEHQRGELTQHAEAAADDGTSDD